MATKKERRSGEMPALPSEAQMIPYMAVMLLIAVVLLARTAWSE